MLNLIPLPYKIGIAIAVIGFLGLVYWAWKDSIYDEGFEACQIENKAIQDKAKEESHARVKKVSERARTAKKDYVGKATATAGDVADPNIMSAIIGVPENDNHQ